jgi:hypothetical protein
MVRDYQIAYDAVRETAVMSIKNDINLDADITFLEELAPILTTVGRHQGFAGAVNNTLERVNDDFEGTRALAEVSKATRLALNERQFAQILAQRPSTLRTSTHRHFSKN